MQLDPFMNPLSISKYDVIVLTEQTKHATLWELGSVLIIEEKNILALCTNKKSTFMFLCCKKKRGSN